MHGSGAAIDTHDRARITDFGIATNAAGIALSGDGSVIGTPEYMSPEQLSGSAAIDHRSDVYSTGVMLYQMLTGTLPFHGDSFEAIRAQRRIKAFCDFLPISSIYVSFMISRDCK